MVKIQDDMGICGFVISVAFPEQYAYWAQA